MPTPLLPPKTLNGDGLLLARSLEHEHQRLPIGFNYCEQTNQINIPASDFLDPAIIESIDHVAIIAPTGTEKGVSCVIPTAANNTIGGIVTTAKRQFNLIKQDRYEIDTNYNINIVRLFTYCKRKRTI